MIHPDSAIVPVDPRRGLGVRATRAIPRGTLLWALDRFDIVLSETEFRALGETHRRLAEHFGYRDARDRWIICWDGGRFVNHSCEPAMRGIGPDVMVATRDLEAGAELTCDYAECNLETPMECFCGSTACRGRVSGADLLVHHAGWDVEVRGVLDRVRRVEQPLWPVVLDRAWLEAVIDGREELPSLRAVYRVPSATSTP